MQCILLIYVIYYYGEQNLSLYICFTDHKCCCFEAYWLQIIAIDMMVGRITETMAWVVLSMIGLSVSRAGFRTLSVSKCANHLAQFMCVVCFMLEGFFCFVLRGDEQIPINVLLDQFCCTVKMVSNCSGYLLSSFLEMLMV